MRKRATQEDRQPEQANHKADRQHNQGDAKAKADHHHHETNHDRRGVPEDALMPLTHRLCHQVSACVITSSASCIGKVDTR